MHRSRWSLAICVSRAKILLGVTRVLADCFRSRSWSLTEGRTRRYAFEFASEKFLHYLLQRSTRRKLIAHLFRNVSYGELPT
jgi:hypothetical protein